MENFNIKFQQLSFYKDFSKQSKSLLWMKSVLTLLFFLVLVPSNSIVQAQTFNSLSQTQLQTNFYSGYTLTFTIKNGTKYDIGIDAFTITFPAGYTVPATIATSSILVNNGTDGGAPTSVVVTGQDVTIYTPVTFNAPAGIKNGTITIYASAKIKNPETAGTYNISFDGSVEPAYSPLSRSSAIVASTTQISTPSVSPNTSVENRSAQYNISFTTGQGGFLSTSATVTVVFPSGTTVPEGAISGVTMNNASTDAVGSSASRTVTIAVPVNIDNSASVQIVIGRSAGLKNPTSGSYTLDVNTSSETTPVTSSSYSISSADNLSFSDISVSNDTVNATATYTVDFVVSNSGALSPSFSDEISLKFPSEIILPASALGTDVVFTNLTSGFSGSPSFVTIDADSMYFPVPIVVDSLDEVRVEFSSGLNILNAAFPASYILSAATYETDGTPIDEETNSNPFAIVVSTSLISNIIPTLSSFTNSATGVTYTISANTGKYGRLVEDTEIDIEFPATTTFNSTGATTATVQGIAATVGILGQVVTVTVPAGVTVNNSSSFTVIVTNIGNATSNGGYSLVMSSTPEQTGVASATYNLGASAVTTVTVSSVTPSTVNTAAAYTIAITGASKLNAGSKNNQAITVVFPDGTDLPATIATGNVTLNGGATVSGVTVDQSTRTVVITVSTNNYTPSSVVFAAAAAIKNPPIVKTGYYTLSLSTSENAVSKTSGTYNITANTTSPVTNSVSVVSSAVDVNAQYTIAFTPGTAGKLVGGIPAGSSTVDVKFPTEVIVPATMNKSNVKLNNTTVESVSILSPGASGRVQITVANGQTLPASTQANISFSSAAGLVNGSTPGTYTVQVATSSETTLSTGIDNLTLTDAPNLSVNSISVSPNVVNSSASYSLNVLIGDTVKVGDTITLTFPTNVYLPTPFSKNYIIVDGTSPSSNPTVSSNQLIITSPKQLVAGNSYSIQISSLAGVLNPQATGSSYVVGISTTHETNVDSPTYSIIATTTTVSTPTVTLSNPATSGSGGTNVSYTINFNSGTNGRLISGTSTITIRFNASTTFGTVTTTVDGNAASFVRSGQDVTITVPIAATINNSDGVVVVVNGVTNPATQANYTLQVNTSVETTYNTSSSYTINNQPPVTISSFAMVDNVVNAVTDYTINLTGITVALTATTGTITVTFPTGSVIPVSVATSNVTVNVNGGGAVNATAVVLNLLNRTVRITTPTLISIGNPVEIVIASGSGISNPKEPGLYKWSVNTSGQQVNAETADQTLVASTATSISGLNVVASPQLQNTPVTWTWTFTTGARGALQAGSGKIYLDFDQSVFTLDPMPLTTMRIMNSIVPAYTLNGSVLELTVPSDVTITNNFPVEVVITSSAGIQAAPDLTPAPALRKGASSGKAPSIAATNDYSANTSSETNQDIFVGNPLPVELSSFSVELQKETMKPLLRWTTVTEKENYGFILERTKLEESVGAETTEWKQIGFVKGQGFSTEIAEYQFTDKQISEAGNYKYRLVQQDFDGTITIASTTEFLYEQPSIVQLHQNYPNPFNPTTTISYDIPLKQKVQLRIYDIMGRVVQTLVNEEQVPGRYSINYNAIGLSSGVYFLRLQSQGVDKAMKMTLLK